MGFQKSLKQSQNRSHYTVDRERLKLWYEDTLIHIGNKPNQTSQPTAEGLIFNETNLTKNKKEVRLDNDQKEADAYQKLDSVRLDSYSRVEKVEQAGKEWERIKGTSINSLDLTEFCLWYCENKDKSKQPSEIKVIAEKVFKLTPEPQYIKIRFLKDIPRFVGYDGKDYGAFKNEDIATIPLVNAQALITRQAAEKMAG